MVVVTVQVGEVSGQGVRNAYVRDSGRINSSHDHHHVLNTTGCLNIADDAG